MIPLTPTSKTRALLHRRLAQMLGTTPESLTGVTNVRLHQNGWVSFQAPDRSSLAALSSPQDAE